ncbi:hypothetical protein DFQ27_009951 [Actinomortierella ambigua]|uniref:Uncharacterized protein n=1 Tax=Actinomortierella ambigua TaxID=1343610 RepID=A0A9P6PLN5_9FUNG|nr:hypothetical protein DFQ27_009951 [Actinomortierella ambigua]
MNLPWTHIFKEVPEAASYFRQLQDPAEISHPAYLQQKRHDHNLWRRVIMPKIEAASIERVAQQYARLQQEWSGREETEAFWAGVVEQEEQASN